MTNDVSPELQAKMRQKLGLGSDAPFSLVLAAIDLKNAQACARLGLPANTPPKVIRATEKTVAAARAEAARIVRGEMAAATRPAASTPAPVTAAEPQPRMVDGISYPPLRGLGSTSNSIDWDALGAEGDEEEMV